VGRERHVTLVAKVNQPEPTWPRSGLASHPRRREGDLAASGANESRHCSERFLLLDGLTEAEVAEPIAHARAKRRKRNVRS
jgi:hypothetical protein